MHIEKNEDYAKMSGYYWVDQREELFCESFLGLCYFMEYPPWRSQTPKNADKGRP